MAKEKLYNDTAVFIAGHAMILGHKPNLLSMDQINTKLESDPQQTNQFGLFDRSTPNYSTYYPDVTAEDLNPVDSEFVEPVFRMLSNITIHAKFNPIYFPSDVLKKNMYKMVGQTVNIDHEIAVGNAIGSVKAVEWQNAYTANDIKIPAGFNAVLKIDGKSNPRIARGIMMDPPSIHSNSVTVNFNWKPSHPAMDESDFRDKIGSIGTDGKLIQRIVVDIVNFHETSLVSHGADPFAQKVVNGKIVNPSYAGRNYSLSADNKNNVDFCWYDWKSINTQNDTTSFNTTDIYNINTDNNFENMDAILRSLETLHGLEVDSLTVENYLAKITELNVALVANQKPKTPEPVVILNLTGVDIIEAEITSLRAFKETVPADLSTQIAMSAIGKVAIDEIRIETNRFYKLAIEEGKEDASILAVIAGADYKTLQALSKQYKKLAEDKFELTCDDCHSHNVSRATALNTDDDKSKTVTHKSVQDVIDQFTSVKMEPLPNSLQAKK